MIIDGRQIHAGGARDVADGNRLDAAFGKEPFGCVENPFAGFRRRRAGRPGWSRSAVPVHTNVWNIRLI